jgi:geranylgeranyl pyrophosphate synthase
LSPFHTNGKASAELCKCTQRLNLLLCERLFTGVFKVDKVLEIFKACKVDEWAESLKVKYVNEAFAHLENIAVVEKRKQPTIELAHYLMNRTK